MLNVEYLVTRPATQNYTPTFLSTLSRYTIPSNHISDKNCNPIYPNTQNLNVNGIVIHRAYSHTYKIY